MVSAIETGRGPSGEYRDRSVPGKRVLWPIPPTLHKRLPLGLLRVCQSAGMTLPCSTRGIQRGRTRPLSRPLTSAFVQASRFAIPSQSCRDRSTTAIASPPHSRTRIPKHSEFASAQGRCRQSRPNAWAKLGTVRQACLAQDLFAPRFRPAVREPPAIQLPRSMSLGNRSARCTSAIWS